MAYWGGEYGNEKYMLRKLYVVETRVNGMCPTDKRLLK